MLTKDEMYDLYFNKGCVMAVKIDEIGAFIVDLIDNGYVSEDIGKKMYRKSNNYSEYRSESIIYWMGKFYDNKMPTLLFRDYVETAVHERYLILYSAQDTVKNIKLRIAEQTQKMKDNDDEIKKYKAEIKEIHSRIGDLCFENALIYENDILKGESWIKQYGINR